MPGNEEIKVFISTRTSTCDECKEELGRQAWITINREKGALCLSCGDIDHLYFLPSGDAALTRRARKHSTLSAIVLKWSTARKHYERQGLLVEEKALEQAESECLADSEARARRKEREQKRRAEETSNTSKPSPNACASYSPTAHPTANKKSSNTPAANTPAAPAAPPPPKVSPPKPSA
ncbi:MAG: hypothetical protein QOE77_823 [Blastocatellia bacterium]|jgi:hypothetical protein|nr:hypothetical protein [Blastocatellia bacterium]